jgi:hypothetical protein
MQRSIQLATAEPVRAPDTARSCTGTPPATVLAIWITERVQPRPSLQLLPSLRLAAATVLG